MKALVTGGAGFIGSHICEKLVSLGYEVISLDDYSAGKVENLKGIDCIKLRCNICNPLDYELFFKNDIDIIFHNAASKKNISMKNPQRDLEVNAYGTLALLKLSVKYGVKKFIYASTGSVFGNAKLPISENTEKNPCSFYGISKLAGENYVNLFNKLYGLDTTILRYFHVYGERQENSQEKGGVIAIFKRKIQEGNPITIFGDGNQVRLFTHVSDIVDINIKCMETSGQDYCCASGYQTTINELAEKLMKKMNKKVEINYMPTIPDDIYYFDIDNSKIKNDLKIKFKTLNEKL